MADVRQAPDGGLGALAPLVAAVALKEMLSSASPPAVLDVRWKLGGPPGHQMYLAGPPGSGAGGRHPLPSATAFESAMRRAGLRSDQLAVAYDAGDSLIAGRLWWLLRYFGHDEAAVLDGGLRAWSAAGLPVTTQVPSPAPGDFTAGAGGEMPVLDDDAAARMAKSGIL